MTWRNLLSAGLVVGLCGGALAAGTVWQQNSDSPRERRMAVAADGATREFLRSARLACPALLTPDDDADISAVSLPQTPGQTVPGRTTIRTRAGKVLASVTEPGATALADSVVQSAAASVAADGGLAPGLVSAIVSADPRGEGKGLASAPCVTPGAEAWLLGGGSQPGRQSVLLLTNPTESDSLVDLAAFAKGGALELARDDGITVPAGSTTSVRLDALAPDNEALAIRVRTRTGLIAAAISDSRMNGLTPMGSELLLPVGEPQRATVLAALPAGAGSRELQILAPKGSGTVAIAALTENGPLPLLAGEPVAVKEGVLTVLDVTKELGGRAAALQITGDVPVVAAATASTAVDATIKARRSAAVAAAERAIDEAKGDAERAEAEAALTRAETANAIEPGEDIASFGPAEPIRRGGITGLRADLDVTVLLTATGGGATAELSLLPAKPGATPAKAPRPVQIADDTTVAVPLRGPAATYTAIIRRTGGPGRLHVSHVQLDDGRTLTGYPAAPLAIQVPLDPAQISYGN